MWGVIGHEDKLEFFDKSIKEGTLAHSFLITGIDGVGKKEFAIAIARRLICKSELAPCLVCNTCRKIYDYKNESIEQFRYKHPDVTYMTLKAEYDDNKKLISSKSEIVVEQIRSMQNLIQTAPFEGSARVIIIEQADKMTTGAANALLKLLEEPPRYVYFFLLTSNPGAILETIISRCTRIDLLPVPVSVIKDHLVKNYVCDEEKADLIANLSNGAPIAACNYLNDEAWWNNRITTIDELFSVIELSRAKRFDFASRFGGTGADKRLHVLDLLNTWLIIWRDILLCNVNLDKNVINKDYLSKLKLFSSKMRAEDIRKYLFEIKSSIIKIQGNANIQLAMEVLMLDMPMLSN